MAQQFRLPWALQNPGRRGGEHRGGVLRRARRSMAGGRRVAHARRRLSRCCGRGQRPWRALGLAIMPRVHAASPSAHARTWQKMFTVQGTMPREAAFTQTLCADVQGRGQRTRAVQQRRAGVAQDGDALARRHHAHRDVAAGVHAAPGGTPARAVDALSDDRFKALNLYDQMPATGRYAELCIGVETSSSLQAEAAAGRALLQADELPSFRFSS